MKLFVLYGQRTCSYPGEYAPEALECIDDVGQDINPDFLIEKRAEYEASNEFDSLVVVELAFPDEEVLKALNPAPVSVESSVESIQ